MQQELVNGIIKQIKNKQYISTALGVSVLLILAYFLFFYKPLPTIWQPVGKDLLFAIHYKQNFQDSALVTKTEALLSENIFKAWGTIYAELDTTISIEPTETVVSWHIDLNGIPQVLFSFGFNDETTDEILQKFNNTPRVKTRLYRATKIYQLSLPDKTIFAYRHKNVLASSTSASLLEKSIRTLTQNDYLASSTLADLPYKNEMGLLFNKEPLGKWLSNTLKLPISFDDVSITHTGFLTFSLKQGSLVAKSYGGNTQVSNQKINHLENKPTNLLFCSKQSTQKVTDNSALNERKKLLKKRLGFDTKSFTQSLGKSFTQIMLTSESPQQPYKLIAIPLKDSLTVVKELALLHPNTPIVKNGFTRIKQPEFPKLFLNPVFSDFPATFYCIKNKVLWLSNFDVALAQVERLESLKYLPKHSFFLNISKLTSYFASSLTQNKKVKKILEGIGNIRYTSSQDSVTICIDFQNKAPTIQAWDTLFATQLSYPPKSKIFTVKNHITNVQELVWQDSRSGLNLLNDTGKVLWRKAVWRFAKSSIHQVDIYQNEKLQYTFVSDGYLHAYDRLGRKINGFPIALPTFFEGQFLLPLRWQGDKEQRFLVAGSLPGNKTYTGGKMYMYNRYGGLARGWAPRNLEAPLACTPQIISYQGKDLILTLLKNGSIYAFDKKGEIHAGFPLITNLPCSQPFVVDKNQHIFFMSDGGTLIQLDLNGQLLKRQQIENRFSGTYQFVLDERQSNHFMIAQQLGKELILKNQFLDPVFSYSLPTTEKVSVKLYDFSYGNEVFLIYAPKSKYCLLLDIQGKLLLKEPIESDFMPLLVNQSVRQLLVGQQGKILLLSQSINNSL